MKLKLFVTFLLLQSVPVHAEDVWLVIGASDPTPAGIAKTSKTKGRSSGIIVQSRDCGDVKNVFAWVPMIEPSAEAARQSLKVVKRTVPDAYIKKCRVRPGSLLAIRENAVHSSIADVPATAVNWDDTDRVTTIQPLDDTWHVVISRYYDGSTDDPLEGRRERPILVGEGGTRQLLHPCLKPENFVVGTRFVAFQCTAAQAGDELLHNVVVYSMAGSKVKDVRHCRNPRFKSLRTIICEREAVGPDGALELQRLDVAF